MKFLLRTILCVMTFLIVGCATVQQNAGGKPSLEDLLRKANAAYAEARLDDAERLYRRTTEHYPTVSQAWFKLGNVYFRTGRYTAAIRAYEKTLQYDRENVDAWHNLALTRVKQATRTLDTALKRVPDRNDQKVVLTDLKKRLMLKFSDE